MPSKPRNQRRKNVSKNTKNVKQVATPVVEQSVEQSVEPVVEQSVEPVEQTVKQKGGSRRKGKKQAVTTQASAPVETVTETVTETATEQVTEAFTEAETTTATETNGERRARSFKVLLPNSNDYEGRFTGLTPYQAANKALSKYYRETNKPKKEIQFSIRESTRGSKRSVYTYNGRREKLKVPVEYSIKDGRTIVKQYKNRLIKVKKSELMETATTSA